MNELRCPECMGRELIKLGPVWSGRKLKQRYLCKECGRTTIAPIIVDKELVLKPA